MAPRYRVTLTVEERAGIEGIDPGRDQDHRQAVPLRAGAVVVRPRFGRARMDQRVTVPFSHKRSFCLQSWRSLITLRHRSIGLDRVRGASIRCR